MIYMQLTPQYAMETFFLNLEYVDDHEGWGFLIVLF